MIFSTTVIATIARPTLARAVNSVLQQQLATGEFEVIVVNDSGRPLPAEDWQKSTSVRVIDTPQREKSIARNTGAALGRGEYLHFLDDDDELLPGALESLWQLTQGSPAVLFFGGGQLTDRHGRILLTLQQDFSENCFIQLLAGEWIPLGSYIVKTSAFFDVGGFNHSMTIGEDSDFCRRMALYGDFARTSAVVLKAAVGRQGSSANYDLLLSQSRSAREMILDQPGAYMRMRSSACDDYWFGRIVRVYLTSVIWNLSHKRVFTAASRAFYGGLSIILAGRYTLSPRFWRAIRQSHESIGIAQGLQREASQ